MVSGYDVPMPTGTPWPGTISQMTKSDGHTIQADVAEELSPHDKALYEAGKNLLVESVSVRREFFKFMTTTALSAIPIYLGLLKLVLPKDYVLQFREEVTFLVPPVAFLVSSVLFVLGYFPQRGCLSLDLPSEIKKGERDGGQAWKIQFSQMEKNSDLTPYIFPLHFPT